MFTTLKNFFRSIHIVVELFLGEKAGVFIIYDPQKRDTNVVLHNLTKEGGHQLTIYGLQALEQSLLREGVFRKMRANINVN